MSKHVLVTLQENSSDASWLNNGLAVAGERITLHIPGLASEQLRAIQQAGRSIESMGAESVELTGKDWSFDAQWAFAKGFSSVKKSSNVSFTGSDSDVAKLTKMQNHMAWIKDLVHQTPAQLYPEQLSQLAIEHISQVAGDKVSVKTISGEALEQEGWTGVYNVGKGSQHAPVMTIIDYNPNGTDADVDIALVGKGITFDSGGYSLKSNEGMVSMKGDMAGAAVVAGALALAIELGLQKRVVLILCCAENMISGHAYKLGDILTYKNGTTVEILNTDAEGRLVLADGLMAAAEYNPVKTINAATLTGAAVMALGGDYTALFSLDDDMITHAQRAADETHDPAWRLPLEPWHKEKCPSPFADTANSRAVKGGGAGGASNAAGFLSRFAPNNGRGWLHIDLAADYNGTSNSLWSAGASGSGVMLITHMLLTD